MKERCGVGEGRWEAMTMGGKTKCQKVMDVNPHWFKSSLEC